MVNKRYKLKQWYEIAKVMASMSYAKRLKVGCVVIQNDRIISSGVNAMPDGYNRSCEIDENTTDPRVYHAEANALLGLLTAGPSPFGADMVITHSPCMECAKLIARAGIRHVYYAEEYRNTPWEFLEKMCVKMVKLELD